MCQSQAPQTPCQPQVRWLIPHPNLAQHILNQLPGDQTKQLPPLSQGQSPTLPSPTNPKLPLLQTAVPQEKRPDPALSSPLDPLTPSNLHSPPATVVKSQWEANAQNEATQDSRVMQEKNEMENELHSKVPESPVTSESPTSVKRSLLGMLGLTSQ